MSAKAFFRKGEISRLLREDSGATPGSDWLDPFRHSAAVMVAFNPETLRPAGGSDRETVGTATALVPELVRSSGVEDREQFGWSLSVPARKDALQELYSRTALEAALQANPVRPKSLLQETFVQAVQGNTFNPAEMTGEALTALATISDWLSVTELAPILPPSQSLRKEMERRRDYMLLERLEGKYFTGREEETARILKHCASFDRRILFIHGAGGSGKSALIAHGILNLERNPSASLARPDLWIRIDLDQSDISPENPSTILQEAAAQLLRRFPEHSLVIEDFLRDVTRTSRRRKAAVESADFANVTTDRHTRQFLEMMLHVRKKASSTIVFWLDTFEEAQFLGENVVAGLWAFIESLVEQEPSLRIIVSGRAPLRESPFNLQVNVEALPDLPLEAAQELLAKLLEGSVSDQKWADDSRLMRAVQELGGNPLTLHLAADLIEREGFQLLDNPGNLKKEALQRWLYSRILQHLHNPDLEKLAVPGMVLRKVTPEIIEKVLAPHCGLGPVGPDRADVLQNALSGELTLVEKNADGSLRHRQDIRLLMIEGMPADLAPQIHAIDEAAVAFWAARTGGEARAEEIYHLLRLNVPTSMLDRRWLPSVNPFLRSALDEFPSGSEMHRWLATKLKAGISQMEMVQLGQQEWEELADAEATRLVAAGSNQLALATLQQRSERLPGSQVFGLQSRIHLLLGQRKEALEVAREGMRAAGSEFAQSAADLALLAGFILEGDKRYDEALQSVVIGGDFAHRIENIPLCLLGKVRQLRLRRRLGSDAVPGIRDSIGELARILGPNFLTSDPSMLREIAAEAGESDIELLRWATNVLLEELLLPIGNADLVTLLIGCGLASDSDRRLLTKIDPIELQKNARSRIEESLYASTPDSRLLSLLQELFRRKVDETVFRQPGMSPIYQVSEPKMDNAQVSKEFLNSLAGLMSELSDDTLHNAARFILRTDYSKLDPSKSKRETALELVDLALQTGKLDALLDGIETVQLELQPQVAALRESLSTMVK